MSRGEPEKPRQRAPGIAIAVTFGVVCLAATLLVVWTTGACEGCTPWSWIGFTPPAPPVEPFPGAQSALVPLRWRDCPEVGAALPGATGTAHYQSEIERELTGRGYIAGAAWTTNVVIPADVTLPADLAGGCGVVAFVADPGSAITRAITPGGSAQPCDANIIAPAVCDGETLRLEGSGMVSLRAFTMPGLTPPIVAATGVPAEALLAHAEAEQMLRAHAWTPIDEVVLQDVPPGSIGLGGPGSRVTASVPKPPARECTPWVAVGIGGGNAEGTWPGYVPDVDRAPSRFMGAAVECVSTPGVTLTAMDDGTPGLKIWWRAYGAAGGPALPGAPTRGGPVSTGSVRVVTSRAATLPTPIPATPPPEAP